MSILPYVHLLVPDGHPIRTVTIATPLVSTKGGEQPCYLYLIYFAKLPDFVDYWE